MVKKVWFLLKVRLASALASIFSSVSYAGENHWVGWSSINGLRPNGGRRVKVAETRAKIKRWI